MNLNTTYSKVFFPNLDGFRTFAFLWVFLHHGFYDAFRLFEGWHVVSDFFINFLFLNGGTGVQIFFVLSGFLITYLLLKEKEQNGRINLNFFYIRRTLRIWPLYFATVLFAFVFYPYIKSLLGVFSHLCSRPFYYFTFLANFDVIHILKTCPGRDAMTQNIMWSVSIEEQFYLFWPLIFLIFPVKKLPFVFGLIILGSLFFRIFHREDGVVLYFHTLAVTCDLAMGGLAAWLCIYSRKFRAFFINQKKGAILYTYYFIYFYILFKSVIVSFGFANVYSRLFENLFWIYVIVEQNISPDSFYKMKNFKWLSGWGKYTYGLYMLHPVAILIISNSLVLLKIPQESFGILVLRGIIAFGLSMLLARISYKLLEMPFLKLKDRFALLKTGS